MQECNGLLGTDIIYNFIL